jgi:hypothetical protein
MVNGISIFLIKSREYAKWSHWSLERWILKIGGTLAAQGKCVSLVPILDINLSHTFISLETTVTREDRIQEFFLAHADQMRLIIHLIHSINIYWDLVGRPYYRWWGLYLLGLKLD